MTKRFGEQCCKGTALGIATALLLLPSLVLADGLSRTYRGFLAFDHKGKEIRELMMISFKNDGTMIMAAEEGHGEPVDPKTGLATKNDVESTSLGL